MTDAAPTNHYLLLANTNEFSTIDKVHYALQHQEMFASNRNNITSSDEHARFLSGNVSGSVDKSVGIEDALYRRWLLRSLTEIKYLMNSPDTNTFTSPSTNTGTTHNTHYTSPFPLFEPSSSLSAATLQREQVWREEELEEKEEPLSHLVLSSSHNATTTNKNKNNAISNTRSNSSGNSMSINSNYRPYEISQELHNNEREKTSHRMNLSQGEETQQKEMYENWPVEVLYQFYHVILTIDFGADCFRVAHNGEVFIDRIPDIVKGLIKTIRQIQRTRESEVNKIRSWLERNVTDEVNNFALHSLYSHSTSSRSSSESSSITATSNSVSPTTNTATASVNIENTYTNPKVTNSIKALIEEIMKQVWSPNIVLTILLINVPLVETCTPAPSKLNTQRTSKKRDILSSMLNSVSRHNKEDCKTDSSNNINNARTELGNQDASNHNSDFLKYTESRFSLLNSVFLQPKHKKITELGKSDNNVNESNIGETIVNNTETFAETMQEKLLEMISSHKEMEEEMSVIPLLVRCNTSNIDETVFLETFRKVLTYYENRLRSAANEGKWPEQRFHCTLHHLVNLLPASPCGECQSVVMITNSDFAQCNYKIMNTLQKEVRNKNCIVSIVSLNRTITLDSVAYDPLTQFLFNIGGFVTNFDYWSAMSSQELNQRWCQSFDGYRCLSQQLFVHLTNHFPVVLDSKLASTVMTNTVRLHSLSCLSSMSREKLKSTLASASKSNVSKFELRVLLGYSNDTFTGRDTLFPESREIYEQEKLEKPHTHRQSNKERKVLTFELYNADHGLADFTYTESPESLLEVIASARICQGWSVVINHNTNASGATSLLSSSSTLIAKQTWRLTSVDCIEVVYEMNINLPVVYRRVIVKGSANALYLLWITQHHYKQEQHRQQQGHQAYTNKEENVFTSMANLSTPPENLSESKHAAFQELLLHYIELEMEIVAEKLAIELISSCLSMLTSKPEFCNLLQTCSFADGVLPAWGAFAQISCFGLFVPFLSCSKHQSAINKEEIHDQTHNELLEQSDETSRNNLDIATREWCEICKNMEEVLRMHNFVYVCKNTACSSGTNNITIHESENGVKLLQKMVFVSYDNNIYNNKGNSESLLPVYKKYNSYSWYILELFPHLLEVESHENKCSSSDENNNHNNDINNDELQSSNREFHINCVECRLCSIGVSTLAHAHTTNELMKILTPVATATQNIIKYEETQQIESRCLSESTVNLLCSDLEANRKAMLLLISTKRPISTSWLEELSYQPNTWECEQRTLVQHSNIESSNTQSQNKTYANQQQQRQAMSSNCSRNSNNNFAVQRAYIHLQNSSPLVRLAMSPWEFLDALVQRWEITRNNTSLKDAHIIFDIMRQRRLQTGFAILCTSCYSNVSGVNKSSEESNNGKVSGNHVITKRVVLCKSVKVFDEMSAICVFDILEHTIHVNPYNNTNDKNDQTEESVITVQRVLTPYSNIPHRVKLKAMLTRDVQEDADVAHTFQTFNNLLQHSASPEQRREMSYEQLVERAIAHNTKSKSTKSTEEINLSKLLGASIKITGNLPQAVRANLPTRSSRSGYSNSNGIIRLNNTENDGDEEGNSALKLVEHVHLTHSEVITLEIPSSLSKENKNKLFIKLLELITSIGNTTACVPMSLLSLDVQNQLQLKEYSHTSGEFGYALVAMLCPAESNMLYLTLIDITPIANALVEQKLKNLAKREERYAYTPPSTTDTTNTNDKLVENKYKSKNHFEDLLSSITSLNVLIAMMTKEEMVSSLMNKYYTCNTQKPPVYTQKETKIDCVIVTILRTLIVEMHAAYSAQLLLHELLTSELIDSKTDIPANHENSETDVDVDITKENTDNTSTSALEHIDKKQREIELEEFNRCAAFMATFELPIRANYLWHLINWLINENQECATLSTAVEEEASSSPPEQNELSIQDTLQLALRSVLLKYSSGFVEQPELFIPHVALRVTSYGGSNSSAVGCTSGSTIVTTTSTEYYEPSRNHEFKNAVGTTNSSSSLIFDNNVKTRTSNYQNIIRNNTSNFNNVQVTPLVLGVRATYKPSYDSADHHHWLEKLQEYELQHKGQGPVRSVRGSFVVTSIPSEKNKTSILECTSVNKIFKKYVEPDELKLHLTFHSLPAYLITLFELQRVLKEKVHNCLNKMYSSLRKEMNNNNMESEQWEELLRNNETYSSTHDIDTDNATCAVQPSGFSVLTNSTHLLSSTLRELYSFADVEKTRVGCAMSYMCEQVRERIAIICMCYTLCSKEYSHLWCTTWTLKEELPHEERIPEMKLPDEEKSAKWPVNALSVLIHNENTQVYKTLCTISYTNIHGSDNNVIDVNSLSKLQTLFTTIVLPALRENNKFCLGSVDIQFTQQETSMYENINPFIASQSIFRRCVDEDKMCVWGVEEGVYFFLPNSAWSHHIILCVELHIIPNMAVNKAMVYGCCLHDIINDNNNEKDENDKFFTEQSTNCTLEDKLQRLFEKECQNDSDKMQMLANALRKHLCDKVSQVSQLHLLKQLREMQEASVELIPSFWGDQFGEVGRAEAELSYSNQSYAQGQFYDKWNKGKRRNKYNKNINYNVNNKNNFNNFKLNIPVDANNKNTLNASKNSFTTTNTKKNTSVTWTMNSANDKQKNYNNQRRQIENTRNIISVNQFSSKSDRRKNKYNNNNNYNDKNATLLRSGGIAREQSLYFLRGQNVLEIPLYSKLQDQCPKVLGQIVTNASRLELISINNRLQCFVVSDEKEVDTFHYIRLVFVKNTPSEASLDAPSKELFKNTLCSTLLVQLFTAISRASIDHILHKISEFCYVLAIEELQAHLKYVQNTLISFHDAVLLQNVHRSTYRIDILHQQTLTSADNTKRKNEAETKTVESCQEEQEQEWEYGWNEENKCKLGEIALALLFWHFRENKYKLFDVQDRQLAGSSQFNDFYKLDLKESVGSDYDNNNKNDESEKSVSDVSIMRTLYFIKSMDVVSDVLVSCKVQLVNNAYILVESFTTRVPEERHCSEMYESSIEHELAQLVQNVQVQITVYKSFSLFAKNNNNDRKTFAISEESLPEFANNIMENVSRYNKPEYMSNASFTHHDNRIIHSNSNNNNNLYTRHEQHMANQPTLISNVHGGVHHTINSAMLHTGNISTMEINPVLLPYMIENLCGVLEVYGVSCFVDADDTTTYNVHEHYNNYILDDVDNNNKRRVTNVQQCETDNKLCRVEHVRGFSWECIETMQSRIDADITQFYITCNIPVCTIEKCNTSGKRAKVNTKPSNKEQENKSQHEEESKDWQGKVSSSSTLEPEEEVHTPLTRALPYTLPNMEPDNASVFKRNKIILSENHFCTNTLNSATNTSSPSSIKVSTTPDATTTTNPNDVKAIKISEPQILLTVSLLHGISFVLFNVLDAELVISLMEHVVNDLITKSSLLLVIMSQRCGFDLVHPFTETDLALQCCGNVYDIVQDKPVSIYTDIYRRRVNHVRFPLKLKEQEEHELKELAKEYKEQYTEHECAETITENDRNVIQQKQKQQEKLQKKERLYVDRNEELLSNEEKQKTELEFIKKLPLLFKLLYRLYNQGLIVNYSFAAEDAIKALYDECPSLSLVECEDLVQWWLNEHTFEIDPHSHLLPQRSLHHILQRSYKNNNNINNTSQESQHTTLITVGALLQNTGISEIWRRGMEEGGNACKLVAERSSLVQRATLPVYKFVRHDWLQLPIDALVACEYHRHVMIAHILAEAERTQHATEEALHTCDVMWSKVENTRLAQDSEILTDDYTIVNSDAAVSALVKDTNKFRQYENTKQQRQLISRQETNKKKKNTLQRKLQVLELTHAIVSLQSHSRQLFGLRIPDFVLLKPTWDAKDDILQPELPPRAEQQTIYAHPVDVALEFYMKYIQTQYPAMRLIDLNPDDVRITKDSTLLERLHCRYGKVIAQKKAANANITAELTTEAQTVNKGENKKADSGKVNERVKWKTNTTNVSAKRTKQEQLEEKEEEEEVILFSTHLWYGVIAFADVLRTPKMYNKYGRHLLPLLHRHASTLHNNNRQNNDQTYQEQNNETSETEEATHMITTSLASSGVFIIEVGLQVTHYALDFFMVNGSCLPQSMMSCVAAEFQQSLHFDSVLYDYTVSRLFNELISGHVQLPGTQSTSNAICHLYEHYPTAFRECSNMVTAFTLTDSRVMHLRAVKYNLRNSDTKASTMVIIPEKSELSLLMLPKAKNTSKSKGNNNICINCNEGQMMQTNLNTVQTSNTLSFSNPVNNVDSRMDNKAKMLMESKSEECIYYQYAGIVDWETSRLLVVLVPYNNQTKDVKANDAWHEIRDTSNNNKKKANYKQLNNLAKEAEQRLLSQLLSSTLEERLVNAKIKFTSPQLYLDRDKECKTSTHNNINSDSSHVETTNLKDQSTLEQTSLREKEEHQSIPLEHKELLSSNKNVNANNNNNKASHATENEELEVSLVELDLLRTHSHKVVLPLYNDLINNLPCAIFTLCSQIPDGKAINKIRRLLCPQHVLHVILTNEENNYEYNNNLYIHNNSENEKSNSRKAKKQNNDSDKSSFGSNTDDMKVKSHSKLNKALNEKLKKEHTLIITFASNNKQVHSDSNVLLCAEWHHFVKQEEEQQEERDEQEEPYSHLSSNNKNIAKNKIYKSASASTEEMQLSLNTQKNNELSQTTWMLMEIALYRIKNYKASESTNNLNSHINNNNTNKETNNEVYELITHLTADEKALINAFSHFALQTMYASVSSNRFAE